MTRAWMLSLRCLPLIATAATLAPQDFVRGLVLTPQPGKALQQLPVPDAVYRGAMRADLGDLRVYNVAHVPAPQAEDPVRREVLPLFVARISEQSGDAATRVVIETPQGERVRVLSPVAPPPQEAAADRGAELPSLSAYIVDARKIDGTLRALDVHWKAEHGDSERRVRASASDDLLHWESVVADSTLVHARGARGTLKKNRIAMSADRYHYLRIESIDHRPLPPVSQIVAEIRPPGIAIDHGQADPRSRQHHDFSVRQRAASPPWQKLASICPRPTWRSSRRSTAAPRPVSHGRRAGAAPSIRSCVLGLWPAPLEDCVSMQRAIATGGYGSSRARRRWAGAHRASSSVIARSAFASWHRAQHRTRWPMEARAEPAARDCGDLLQNLSASERATMGGAAHAASHGVVLGGPQAFRPAPATEPALPWARYLLWAVLIAAAGSLIVMALALLRRLQ